jgi:cytochrome c oxidase subunit II
MSLRAPALRRPRRRAGVLLTLIAAGLVAACNPADFPQSALLPRGDFAAMLDDLFMTTVWWALLVFVLVEAALIYAIVKFRGKPDDAEPEQVHGNTVLEIVWTAIPALILAFIAVPTVRAIFRSYEVPAGNSLLVEVIGHQWWWEFRYPEYGITTANELHVPVGRTVTLKMTSADVLHSWWIPQLAGKRDVFPNRPTNLWFTAQEPGFYPGQCAEFCGIQHGKMAFHVVASTPEEFEGYIQHLRAVSARAAPPTAPAPAAAPAADTVTVTTTAGALTPQGEIDARPADTVQVQSDLQRGEGVAEAVPSPGEVLEGTQASYDPALVEQGRALFGACAGCHSLDAVNPMKGLIGPNLANVGARRYIAAGTLRNTDANLAKWIMDPQELKEGVGMLDLGLQEPQAMALVAYLRSLSR